MKKIHRVILILVLSIFLTVSFVVPTAAAVAVDGDFPAKIVYPPVQIEIDWGTFVIGEIEDMTVTYEGTYYDTIGTPTVDVNSGGLIGSVETTSTLAPSGDGSILKQMNNWRTEYSGETFDTTFLHYRYLLKQRNRNSVFMALRVHAYDFYLLPSPDDLDRSVNTGIFMMLQNIPRDRDITFHCTYVIRNIGEDADHYDYITKNYYSPSRTIALDVDDLSSEYFNQTTGDFLGCYVSEFHCECYYNQPFTWNSQSNGGASWPGVSDDQCYTQLEFDYVFNSYDLEAYRAIVAQDLSPEPVDKSMFYKDYTSWVSEAIGGFFEFNVFPGFSLGGIVITVMSFAIAIWLLKIFAGG